MKAYARKVNELLSPPEKDDIEMLCGQLCSEAGEVFGALTKIRRAQHNGKDIFATMPLWHKFDLELGDVLFYLTAIAEYRGWDLANVGKQNIAKLKARKKAGTLTSGSGNDR